MHYAGDMSRFALLAVPVWLVLRTVWLTRREQTPRPWRELWMAILVLYLIGLFSQTLLPLPRTEGGLSALLERAEERARAGLGINLIPLATIRAFAQHGTPSQNLINLAGNVGIFIPLGILLPALWSKLRALWKTLLLCAACSLFIECFQLFIGRSVDVDDLLLNTLGGLAGYLLFAVGRAIFSGRK